MTPEVAEAVLGVGGVGTLGGVVRLAYEPAGFCALLATTAVDCWGYDVDGQLGDGPLTANPICQCSDVPAGVLRGATATAPLTGVSDLASDQTVGDVASSAGPGLSAPGNTCTVLPPGGVSCWGTDSGDAIGPADVYAVLTPFPMPI